MKLRAFSPRRRIRQNAGAKGFTLLEIAVVLIIASLLIGAGSVMVSGMMNDRAVQKAVSGMEAMGVEAVSRAATYRRQQVLSFQKDRCDLYDETGDLIRSVELPVGAQMLIHRYYAKDFAEADGQTVRILPGCLMEPIELILRDSDEDFQFALDPLTGGFNPDA
jgi:prepilin-type N-terminal cleavage/methylation domain-containing protein